MAEFITYCVSPGLNVCICLVLNQICTVRIVLSQGDKEISVSTIMFLKYWFGQRAIIVFIHFIYHNSKSQNVLVVLLYKPYTWKNQDFLLPHVLNRNSHVCYYCLILSKILICLGVSKLIFCRLAIADGKSSKSKWESVFRNSWLHALVTTVVPTYNVIWTWRDNFSFSRQP